MKKILLLLARGFEFYEASVFIDVMGWNLTDGNKNTMLNSAGITDKVVGAFNQVFLVDKTLEAVCVEEYDALAIPGGFEEYGFYEDAYNERFLQIIREFNNHDKLIASVCVGALPVARSGILKGRRATTYRGLRQKQLASYGVNVIDQPLVIDNNIITCWNPGAAVDTALLVLELLTGCDNASSIRKMMGF